jgi:hypothetical protein
MASEIPSSRPSPSIPSVQRPAAPAINSILQLYNNLPAQLNIGDSAQAQVLALREAQQAFQVLLRLSLANGQQSTIEVQSKQPLALGNILNVTVLSAQQLAFSLVPASQAAIATRIDTALLASGTLLEAKVVQVTPNAQGGFKITVSINNSALAGQQLQIDSPKSLPLNSQLNARIDSAQQLTFQPLNTRLEPLAINQELQKQFNQQGSLNQLFQALNTISTSNLSPDAQRTLQQLLGGIPELSQMLDPKKLAQSLMNSGVQLENRLLNSALENANQDVKANLLRLIAQIMPMLPNSNPALAASQSILLSQALPGLLRDQLLGSSQAQLREQALRFPLPTRLLQALDNPNDLGSLLRLAAAAVSRLQTHQLASLGQTHTNSEGTQVTVWQLEIPTRDQHNIVPLQIKFQHEEPAQNKSGESATPVWKIDLSFDLEPLGPLHIQASLQGGSISSQLWAQNSATANLIDHELGYLRERLLGIGLTVKDLSCHQGAPPQGEKTTLQQRWIDDLA